MNSELNDSILNRMPDPSPWQPMTEKIAIKHLGKLGEECTELGTAIFRCLIQGVDEAEPVTGKINREWLTEEIADVLANINLVRRHFDLNDNTIHDRVIRKVDHLTRWHNQL